MDGGMHKTFGARFGQVWIQRGLREENNAGGVAKRADSPLVKTGLR